jgi:hypothetical protein
MNSMPPSNSLYAKAMLRENDRHRVRLSEIDGMADQLAELEEYLPALADASVRLDAHEISMTEDKCLHILPGYFNRLSAKAAFRVLTEQGFNVAASLDHLSFVQVVLAKGSLQILLSIDKTVIDIGPPAVFSDPLAAA